MSTRHSPRVCLVPRLEGVGGMVSFQHRLAGGLAARGVEVSYELSQPGYHAVLVVGGTRQVPQLWQARRRGIPIVQRLDGMNWMHRVPDRRGRRRTSLRHFARAEYGNALLALIRNRIASRIIYQSRFSQQWWERIYGATPVASRVVYNGVDLQSFHPSGPGAPPEDVCRLLVVEGSLMGGYEAGLETAAGLAEGLDALNRQSGKPAVELVIVGRTSEQVRREWDQKAKIPILWKGVVTHAEIAQIDRSSHLLFSADINPACPNSVIEAMACGLPVVSYDTGALRELVGDEGGIIVPYGADPWKLEKPDLPALIDAGARILFDQDSYRRAARARAEAGFGLDTMVDAYLEVLLEAM